MSGLDKIIARITEESAEKAKGIKDEARSKAAAIISDGAAKTAEECGRIDKKADAAAVSTEEKGRASAELRAKQLLLAGKQELMTEVIETARQRLGSMSDSEYKDFIVKLFGRHLPDSDAVLMLNAEDSDRLGSDTLAVLKNMAEQNGARLTISDKPADIRNGFILSYGGVEENCTFDALIDQSMDELLDQVKDILF